MPWQAGDVILVWDHLVHPPKEKRHICVSPERQLYFRINTEPLWPPHVMIRAQGADFLNHDSYVELQQLQRLHGYHIENAARLGSLTQTHKRVIVIALENGGWMTPDACAYIRQCFGL